MPSRMLPLLGVLAGSMFYLAEVSIVSTVSCLQLVALIVSDVTT